MEKANASEKPSETPLERTAQLARKLLAVPKTEADKVKERQARKAKR